MSESYDVVVVGGGTGGCIVAGRLAAAGRRVLLLEAGPRARGPMVSMPGASAFAGSRKATNWSMATTPQAALNGRALFLSQARLLGGGSAINGMVYTRGSAADYDDWQALGADGWGYADVLPFFRRSEANSRGAGPLHGGDGPLSVSQGVSGLPIAEVFLAAAAEAGFPMADDLNRPEGEGIGAYDWMIADGRRVTTAALLAAAGPRLTVRTGARAIGIGLETDRARTVRYLSGRTVRVARADEEIVLCGGAIHTPHLLLSSGIGDPHALAAAGVALAHPLPAVGRNLRNHLAYKVAFAIDAPISAYRYFQGTAGPIEFGRYLLGRRGFLAAGSSPAGGFFRSGPAAARADAQLFMLPALTGGIAGGLRALLPSAHGLSLFVNQGRPESHGDVRLASADPLAPPGIDPGYLSDPRDLPVLAEAVERVRALADTAAFRRIGARLLQPDPGIKSRADLETDIRARASNHFHVAGTCRIGRSPDDSVVDPALRVHGVRNLRIADASVMPRLVNANTAAPVVMIAERAAAFINRG